MLKKWMIVLVVCGLAVNGLAAELQWFGSAEAGGEQDRDWFNPANWREAGPSGIPAALDKIKLNYVWENHGPIIDDVAVAGEIFISEDRDPGTFGVQTLTVGVGGELITGGTVFGGQVILGYYGPDSRAGWPANEGRLVIDGGIMTIGAGASTPGGGHLFVGFGGIGHLEIKDGVLTVLNMFGLGWNGGSATVQLDGGELRTTQYNFDNASDYIIDITGGTWIMDGNRVDAFEALVDAGKITAYGGSGDVVIAYDANVQRTIVTGYIPEPATLALLGFGAVGCILKRKR